MICIIGTIHSLACYKRSFLSLGVMVAYRSSAQTLIALQKLHMILSFFLYTIYIYLSISISEHTKYTRNPANNVNIGIWQCLEYNTCIVYIYIYIYIKMYNCSTWTFGNISHIRNVSCLEMLKLITVQTRHLAIFLI